MWCRVGRRLDLGGTRLLFEDGVVAETLALTLLAIATHGMGFVTLRADCCQLGRDGSTDEVRLK